MRAVGPNFSFLMSVRNSGTPVIPSSSLKVLDIFGINEEKINFETIKENSYLKKGLKLNKLDILFKKIEKND